MTGNDMDIDVVILWVDSTDNGWQERFIEHSKKARPDQDIDPCRFRDWDNLQYLFRGIEKYMPWVRYVYLVTDRQKPLWLNLDCEKLRLIDHKDIIPADRLPSFNSSNIELFVHNIPGLAEHFIYMNDDFFFLKEMQPEDFYIDGVPVDMLALQPVVANPVNPIMTYIFTNNSVVLSRHFNKYDLMKRHKKLFYHVGYPVKYFVYNCLEKAFPKFTGFYTIHGPSPMLKSVYEEVWEAENDAILATDALFRSKTDVNQYLFREWNKLKGNIIPRNVEKNYGYYDVKDDNTALLSCISGQKKKCVCINDTGEFTDFEKAKNEINSAFVKILPKKSSFEL